MSLEEAETDKTMNSHNMQGKNEKFLKTALKITFKVQNTHFLRLEWFVNKSPIQVTKISCDKLWEICLSVFYDWKVHLRISHEGSRKAFWVNLATGASTREPVAKLSCENPKNQYFWNFSTSFSRLGAWLARESWKLLSKLATGVSRLAWLARQSRQNRVAQFLKIFKTKTLSKNN